jgi:hypothetical protein
MKCGDQESASDADGFLDVMVRDFSLLSFRVAHNLKRWHGSDQPLRWTATGLLEAERKFRKVKGFRELANLHNKLNSSLTPQVSRPRNLQSSGSPHFN